MADDPNKKGGAPEKPDEGAEARSTAYFAKNPMPEVPPSKPLQWFLLGAFVITGAAYLVGQWSEKNSVQTQGRPAANLRRQVQMQSDYLAHCKAGEEAFARKLYDQAASEYRAALQSQDTAEGHEHLGRVLLKKNDPEAAFAQFREALRINPKLVNAASDWGLALTAQGNPDEAVRIFREALNRSPDSGLLHYNLAVTLLQMRINADGRRRMAAAAAKKQEAQAAASEAKRLEDEALSQFTEAGRNKFDSPAFWHDYGQLLNELGQYAAAETNLLRAVAEDPGMAAAQFQLAVAEDHTGKYAEAIAHYEKVLTLTPDNTDTLNSLALLYASATNADVRSSKMAVQLAARACDATGNQNARYMDTLARSYAADGDFFQAITWEDKAIHRAMQLNDQDAAREFQGRQAMLMDHKNP